MINTNEFEKIFLLYALDKPVYLEPVERGFFSVPEIDLLATLSKRYYTKFKKSPSKDNLWMLISTGELEDRCPKVFFDEIFKKNIKDYDIEWVEETAQSWIKWKHLDSSIVDTVEYVNTVKVSPENVGDVVETVKNMINGRNNITFDDDLGTDFFNTSSHVMAAEDLLSSNYDFIDKNIGGHSKGTLNVYVAPPNTGKSLFLCQDAANYCKIGKNVLYISLEMGGQKVHKRIGADIFNINVNQYDKKSKDEEFMKRKISEFKEHNLIAPGALTVKNYETSNGTADDIDNFIGKVQELTGIVYDVVLVDYINIMKDKRNPNSESTYIKIKNICEDLRAVAQRRNVVLLSATQTNRAGFDSSSINMGMIAESAGLAATCDTILAIIQTPEMNLDNLYWLKLLKVRDGQGKGMKCKINIDYDYMRLQETNTVIFDDEV
tara:strand:+ start:386 stop:1690 length:1305 start_codon:yes stop_codon:yes gene_type:complete